jgi:hypothetical protein
MAPNQWEKLPESLSMPRTFSLGTVSAVSSSISVGIPGIFALKPMRKSQPAAA